VLPAAQLLLLLLGLALLRKQGLQRWWLPPGS
jgi:hypothetical protein